ncbi:TetR/AcrR family transcriptional regulator [Leptolyngbya sp. Heron Island J]|uniref:TetR/AcrR family transcriptional regulator n=1 Tax=Leptolyngbya sp. Heron Island J TaxID=1385935 RepID=UPI00041AAF0B|nr:TetR/AcrR family transcriptional regulator [Leptolyngbya sp. Heron Island J]
MGSAAVTKQRILDAAERAFGTYGFSQTTLRSIVKDAGVNLALVNYHFGSKEELYQAVVARMAEPIIERQLAALSQINLAAEKPSLEAVLDAYIRPGIDYLLQDQQLVLKRANFFARYFMEPISVQKLTEYEFAESDARFLDILQRAVPEQSRIQLTWKLDAIVLLLVRAMGQIGQPHALIKSYSKTDINAAIAELVSFSAYGIKGE